MKKNGITLVSLVITVIVLIIIAGTVISLGLNTNGLLEKSNDAVEKWNDKVSETNTSINNMAHLLSLQMPETLKPGDTIKWEPSGHYTWDINLYSSNDSRLVTTNTSGVSGYSTDYVLATKQLYSGELAQNTADIKTSWNSGENLDLTIKTWKVLKVNREKGEIVIVPTKPTLPIAIVGATGYNNGVKLLNDACKALYGGNTLGIEVHNINIDEIESYMVNKPVSEIVAETVTSDPVAYGSTHAPYIINDFEIVNSQEEYVYCSNYPTIYAEEKFERISNSDGTTNEGKNLLELSQERTSFISRADEKVTKTDANSIIPKTVSGIRAIHTYYYISNADLTNALGSYASILLPNGVTTNYWVASRCAYLSDVFINYNIRYIGQGSIGGCPIYMSAGQSQGYAEGLFPIAYIDSGTIIATETAGVFDFSPSL